MSSAVNSDSCTFCFIDLDFDNDRAKLAKGAAFVDATDSRYGFSSKDLRLLGGSEIARIPDLIESDHEWSGPVKLIPPSYGNRIVVKLYWDVSPLACENFATLCSNGSILPKENKAKPIPIGESGKPLSYRNSTVHRVQTDFVIQAGDFVKGNGSGGESIYNGKKFKDEKAGLLLKHDHKGVLSMGNSGKNSNSSQFFITLTATPQCDGKHVIFGEVVSGFEILDHAQSIGTSSGEPTVQVTITDCGIYTPLQSPGAGYWYDQPDAESYGGISPVFMVRLRVAVLAPSAPVLEKFRKAMGSVVAFTGIIVNDLEGIEAAQVKLSELLDKFCVDVVVVIIKMASTLYDEETVSMVPSIEPAKAAQKKVSSLRTWGPAMAAIALVIAINASLFGVGFNQLPPTSEKFITKQRLIAERHSAIMAMDFDPVADMKRGKSFGPRNLSEAEGGVMEYTRRRHRFLGEYTHVDVSKEFTLFGKISVSLIYFAFWVFLMFPNWFLPIGRPGIALGGGLLSVVWRYLLKIFGQGPTFFFFFFIIMEPLFLLFGLMLTTIYLEKMERGGLFDKLRDSLDDPINWKRSAKIMAMSTIGSAAVMNDSIVLIFSGVVVDLCVRHKVANSIPYLLSLATTANIGSALTMTGNPQNILIVSLAYDDIGWVEFAKNMFLPVIAATIINTMMVFVYYASELFPGSSGLGENFGIMMGGNRTPEMLAQEHAFYARQAAANEGKEIIETHGWTLWSKIQVLIVVLFLICFAFGLDVCVTSSCAGALLMCVAAYKRQHYDPKPDMSEYDADGNVIPTKKTYDMDGNEIQAEEAELITESETTLTEVDYGLLMLFIGQFILIGSFDDTGVPQAFFSVTMGGCAEKMTEGACVYWFVMIVTILSNIASNVPVCQMLAATFPYASPYDWLQVSFSATIAGNLTMLGSAANMIVAFQAAKVGDRTFTSERHAPFGIPSTLLCLYAGTFLLATFHFSPECSVKLGECDAQ